MDGQYWEDKTHYEYVKAHPKEVENEEALEIIRDAWRSCPELRLSQLIISAVAQLSSVEKTIGNRRVDIFAEKQGECLIIEVVNTHYSGVLDENLFTQVKVSIPKQSDFITEEAWSIEDEMVFRPLYRKWQRIRNKRRVDAQAGGRVRRFGPKKYKQKV